MTRWAVRASLSILAAAEGGRTTPIVSGYRSLARFEGTEVDLGFELELEAESLAPGERGTGRLSFWAVEEVPDLSVGQNFELREGARVVGQGTILDAKL